MKKTYKHFGMTSLGVVSLMLMTSAPAMAQTTEAPQDAQASGGLQDIVVTAQKRAQNVQDVPIAISAVLGESLAKAGVVTTEDLKTTFAGVNIKTTSSQFQPSIRGVGTSTSNVENAVALYIDGVYYANQSDARRELNDIEQVAVLKGPQGTLFGRNATAGVIQITTRAPSHSWSGEVNANVDQYATLRTGAYITGPLSDTLAFSLSGNYTTQGEGWGKNYTTGKDTYKIDHIAAIRGKLLFEPGDNTDITLIGDYTSRRDNLGAYFRAFPGTTVNPLVPYVQPPGVHDSYNNVDSLNRYDGGGASLTINHEFGFGKFQSITAYRKFTTGYIIDADMTRAAGHRLDTSHNKGESFSQEVQLTSAEGSPLNWAVGAFYFHYTNALDPMHRDFGTPLYITSPASYVTRDLFSKETVDSVAPYAQADFEILPATRLTLGARWTYEKRSLDSRWPSTRADGTFVPNSIPAVDGASITAKRPTWRIALDHKFSDDILGYVSWNRGFKSGGFNLANPANPPYKPERLDAYEAGLKTTLLDRKLRLNIAGFYYKYDNLQVLQLSAAAPVITNGAKAELYGVDMDFEAQLTPELRFMGSAEVLHAEFTSYPGAVISFTQPTGGIGTRFGDVSGNRLPLSQKFVANAALDYTKQVSFGEINLNAAVAYNGNYAFDPDNVVKQKGYTNINLAANWTLPDDDFTIGVFVRNLLNNKVISYSTASSPLGYITTYDNPPITYGVSAKYKF
ncbi:TonB-dependent receptor [Sphingobium bisphenolivorans]|uniref:TonB-dependent receptor n=1 Tax=Sphingobium bisphenolivorans TaxID=1335760 RepID=UPI0003A3282E|nr:TonB-dependent receptor [Sphingobium bisphenolivorans]